MVCRGGREISKRGFSPDTGLVVEEDGGNIRAQTLELEVQNSGIN